MDRKREIKLFLGETERLIKASETSPETTLLTFLRKNDCLKATKYMCKEGGCGSCVVAVRKQDPLTKKDLLLAVNSCLMSLYSCHGLTVLTNEGIGNAKTGYHPVQKILARFNGTQCGFCSSGMVMSMYPLYESSQATMKTVEDSFGGNICRCTGYRPILAAFKSLTVDACPHILGTYEPDIEDLKPCRALKQPPKLEIQPPVYFTNDDFQWFKVNTINEIVDVFMQIGDDTYMLVGGNTARGVYPVSKPPKVYIDVSEVQNLLRYSYDTKKIKLGAAVTLSEAIKIFRKVGTAEARFSYLLKFAEHFELVAHVPVRNIGTLAGNLSIKHQNHEFQSDLFLLFTTVGGSLSIYNVRRQVEQVDLVRYLSLDMNKKVITEITLPALDDSFRFESYKVMPVAQNAVAIVNAGFLFQFSKDRNEILQASIVYGNINSNFVHSQNAETYLKHKKLFSDETLSQTYQIMDKEIQPDKILTDFSPEYRKGLAIALFYKFVLSVAPDTIITQAHRSGGLKLARPISTSAQEYQSNESMYPVTQPISKLEALAQTSGEAEYILDVPDQPHQLFACFLTANAVAHSIIKQVDASAALALDGVVAFLDKHDIPGRNTFISLNLRVPVPLNLTEEEVFCSGTVKYYHQPIGIVVATSEEKAEEGVKLVKVTYSGGTEQPLLTIREVLRANATERIKKEASMTATARGSDVKRVLKGQFDTRGQYHYYMETQGCLVVPIEDGLDVFAATQWMDGAQVAIAGVLNIPTNSVNIKVRRLGGSYGGKITRNNLLTCAASVAAYKLKRPVRIQMSVTDNMNVIGKRAPSAVNYEVAVNGNNEIQYVDATHYNDYGTGTNEPIIFLAFKSYSGIPYKKNTWTIDGYSVQTDNTTNIWCRAPGDAEATALVETILEHIAVTSNASSLNVRLANLDLPQNSKLLEFINSMKKTSDFDNRLKQAEDFNRANRWRKKGLSLMPMVYPIAHIGNYSVLVVIYASDGTVAVSHGGIEAGQGINTKVAQVCAYALGISLEMVSVKPSNNLVSPNNSATAASITSESVCHGVLKACEILLNRIQPVRAKMNNPTWVELIAQCYYEQVELQALYVTHPSDIPDYLIYGVCVTEVEVDILTGNHLITRLDLLEDTGNSMSPKIDIGQVEGALIMGIGFWTTERLVYDDGKLLTNRTWTYKVPGAKDIPVDFRVQLPKNNPNPVGVLNSKATGEPALVLSISVVYAIRSAIESARSSSDPNVDNWYPIDGPFTVENTFLRSLNEYRFYTL